MNVSLKVLNEHYDKRFEEVRLEQRQAFSENVWLFRLLSIYII